MLQTLQLDKDSIVTEWMRLKQAGKHLGTSSVYGLVQIVNTSNPDAYSNIIKVVKLSLTLPLSNAACERGFSHLNIIKTKYRSRLSLARLSALMHIHLSMQTKKIFDLKQAVDLSPSTGWMETGQQLGESTKEREVHLQHLHHLPCRKLKQRTVGGDTDEDSEEGIFLFVRSYCVFQHLFYNTYDG